MKKDSSRLSRQTIKVLNVAVMCKSRERKGGIAGEGLPGLVRRWPYFNPLVSRYSLIYSMTHIIGGIATIYLTRNISNHDSSQAENTANDILNPYIN